MTGRPGLATRPLRERDLGRDATGRGPDDAQHLDHLDHLGWQSWSG